MILFVLLWAWALIVLTWGTYEAFYVAVVGRWRLSTYAVLAVILALLLFFVTAAFTPLCDGRVGRVC
jgi:hypothetical protein